MVSSCKFSFCELCFLLLIIFNIFVSSNAEHGTLIRTVQWKTKQGALRGGTFKIKSEEVYKFKKIPFARPPLGNLRFNKPVKANPWKGTLDATKYGPSCIQYIDDSDKRLIPNLETSEDCLHLNIIVPRNLNATNKLAVMVWVHGGSLTNGQGSMFDGTLLALTGNVIFVSINYRVNVFGFFSSSDKNGNLGIFDQHMAFQWVHMNIADYGGDKGKVTIFGASSGSYSVTLHSILPSNYGLFHRVIAESGAIGPLAYTETEQTRASSYQLAKTLNCITATNDIDMECMKAMSAQTLLETYSSLQIEFHVITDGELVKKDMITQLKEPSSEVYQMFHSVDFLAGTNSGEAGLMFYEFAELGINNATGINSSDLCEKIVRKKVEEKFENCSRIYSQLCKQYSPNSSSTLAEETQYAINYYNEIEFLAGTTFLLDQHAADNTTSTYQYYFTYKPAWELIPSRPGWLKGPNHASEIALVFGMDWYPNATMISPNEQDLSKRMMTYWTSFAKTGNPNFRHSLQWKKYTRETRYFINFSIKDQIAINLRTNETMFLNALPKYLQQCREDNNYTIVTTSYGKIKGYVETFENENVHTFKRIPFANPPTGSLRFRKPIKPDPWKGVFDAGIFGPSCYQNPINENGRVPTTNISEDCLHLNVYVPRDISITKILPVMIWIHGGGFTSGQGTSIDGRNLALFGNVIIVTFNYRLNIFGFFSINRNSRMGNYGLYDQQLAIKWVKENIGNFGGDPYKITLFGESAGGVGTTLQALIPSNKGLFQRVIGESGSALAKRDFDTKTYNTSKLVVEYLNCSFKSDHDMLACLQSKTPSVIYSAYNNASNLVNRVYSWTTVIGPMVDGELIIDDPLTSLEDKTSPAYKMFSSVDLLVGTNTADSGLLYFTLLGRSKSFGFNVTAGVPTSVLCDHIAPAVSRDLFSNCPGISQSICKAYSPRQNTSSLREQSQLAANLYGDLLEDAPTVKSLDIHSSNTNKKKTYQYLFSYRPRWEMISSRPTWLTGANHASEIVFVFGLLKQWYPAEVHVAENEIKLSRRIMNYWKNFATYGDPNGNEGSSWPQYDINKRRYLVIDINQYVNSTLHGDRMEFWNRHIPNLISKCHQKHTSVNAVESSYPGMDIYLILFSLFICGLIK